MAEVESSSFISDAEDLWCWLHFSENGNGRSSSAAGDLKAIWCCSRNPWLIMTLTIFLIYRSNICRLLNYNGLRVHSIWFCSSISWTKCSDISWQKLLEIISESIEKIGATYWRDQSLLVQENSKSSTINISARQMFAFLITK